MTPAAPQILDEPLDPDIAGLIRLLARQAAREQVRAATRIGAAAGSTPVADLPDARGTVPAAPTAAPHAPAGGAPLP